MGDSASQRIFGNVWKHIWLTKVGLESGVLRLGILPHGHGAQDSHPQRGPKSVSRCRKSGSNDNDVPDHEDTNSLSNLEIPLRRLVVIYRHLNCTRPPKLPLFYGGRESRLWAARWLTQGHRPRMWRNRDSKPALPDPKTLKHKTGCCLVLRLPMGTVGPLWFQRSCPGSQRKEDFKSLLKGYWPKPPITRRGPIGMLHFEIITQPSFTGKQK